VAGTIIADVIQSDQSYPSSINIASPVIISNTFAFPAGTVSAPAFFPTGDTNTGIFFPAADTIAFAEGGVEAMRINSSGNVGIGTSSPSNKLHVSNAIQTGSNGDAVGVLMGAAALRQNIAGPLYFDAGSTSTAAGIIFRDGSGFAERMRIDSSGNLLINQTIDNEHRVCVTFDGISQGGLRLTSPNSGSVRAIQFVNTFGAPSQVGAVTFTTTATTYATSSDYRLKEDWQPMSGAITRLNLLKPVNFAWKVDGSRVDGFLAHEAQEVVPESVTGIKDAVDKDGKPEYQGIDQAKLVPLLTAALQEAVAKIAALEARLDAANL